MLQKAQYTEKRITAIRLFYRSFDEQNLRKGNTVFGISYGS